MYTSVAETADRIDDSLPFRIPLPSLQGFATFMFVLSQCSTIIELWLRNRLKRARSQAYGETVRSRGKSADWWTDYYEEWEVVSGDDRNARGQLFAISLPSALTHCF